MRLAVLELPKWVEWVKKLILSRRGDLVGSEVQDLIDHIVIFTRVHHDNLEEVLDDE